MWRPDGPIIALAFASCTLLLTAGCGGRTEDGPGYPVTGKVTVDGAPLTAGAVLFVPVAPTEKHPIEPAGKIDKKGFYTLYAEGRRNILPGRYIVVVEAFEPLPDAVKHTRSLRVRGQSLINPSYESASTSHLRVEVKKDAKPADYDLRLKR